jgi:hypothetical protein
MYSLSRYHHYHHDDRHFMHVSEPHRQAGEFFGVIMWLWVFHRLRMDGAVLLGFRHPWEHAGGDDHDDHHHDPATKLGVAWDNFTAKSIVPKEVDDDDDEEEEEGDDDE